MTGNQATCKRCKRTLRAAASVSAGIGPVCKLREARENTLKAAGLTSAQQTEALQLLADHAVIPHSRKGVFLVVSTDGERTYLATSNHCTCPCGLHAMTTATAKPCKHAGAVLARLTRAA